MIPYYLNILTYPPSVYLIYRMMHLFHKDGARHRGIEWAAYLGYGFAAAGLNLLAGIPFVNLVFNLLSYFLLSFNYKSSVSTKALAVALIVSAKCSAEMGAVFVLNLVFESVTVKGRSASLPDNIMILVFEAFFMLGAERILKRRRGISPAELYSIHIFTLLFLTIFIILLLWLKNISPIIFLISMSALLLVNLLSILTYISHICQQEKQKECQRLEKEKQIYSNEIRIMKAYSETLSAIRHNINNHILILKAYLQQGEREKAEEQLEELRSGIQGGFFLNTGVPVVDAVINYKIYEARQKGIEFDSSVAIPYDYPYPEQDIMLLLDHLLETAIRLADREGGPPKIHLHILYRISVSQEKRLEITLSGTLLAADFLAGQEDPKMKAVNEIISRRGGSIHCETRHTRLKARIQISI